MSSLPSSAVDGIAASTGLASSSFFPQAASVSNALEKTMISEYLGDLFADAADMASPFFGDDPGLGHRLWSPFYAYFCAARSARRLVMAASRPAMPGSSLGSG